MQVVALEKQLSAVFTLRDLVQELHQSVDQLSIKQDNLQSEVVQHSAHMSALLTNMQVRHSLPLSCSCPSLTMTF